MKRDYQKNNNFLGINRFKLLTTLTKKKVVALGGISLKNKGYLALLNNPEFGGISFFDKKKAPIKGPF